MNTSTIHNVKFWPVMTAIFFGSFLCILSISTINIAIPDLMHHFGSDLSSMQWTITGFMLATGTIAPITGFLGDRLGYKRLYLLSMAGFTLVSLLCAFAWNSPSLIIFRILQGGFSGLVMPATMTIIYQIIPREKQPLAISLWALSAMLGPAIGPTLSGWIIQSLSWQWLFLLNVPIGIVALFMIGRLIPYYRLSVSKSFDAIGFITVIVSSLSLLVALSEGRAWGWTSTKTLSLFAIGLIVLAIFIWRELKTAEPMLDIRVFKNIRYSLTLVITSIITMSLFSGTFLTPLFMQNIQNVSPLDTGLVLLLPSLAMALAMPLVGKIYSRLGPMMLMVPGIILIGIGTLAMSWLSVNVSHGYIILWMTVRNIGIALSMMPASNAGMEGISPMMSGHASSVSNWVRNVFGSFAIALFTTVLASKSVTHGTELARAGAGNAKSIALLSFTMSVNDVYLLATVIAMIGLPISFFIRKQLRAEPATVKQEVA